jgi:hypothetical protein
MVMVVCVLFGSRSQVSRSDKQGVERKHVHTLHGMIARVIVDIFCTFVEVALKCLNSNECAEPVCRNHLLYKFYESTMSWKA